MYQCANCDNPLMRMEGIPFEMHGRVHRACNTECRDMVLTNAYTWNEPKNCATRRGWFRFEGQPCGWYLDYTGTDEPGKDGCKVFASAYIRRSSYSSPVDLGTKWFPGIESAKLWIEMTVANYLSDSIAA